MEGNRPNSFIRGTLFYRYGGCFLQAVLLFPDWTFPGSTNCKYSRHKGHGTDHIKYFVALLLKRIPEWAVMLSLYLQVSFSKMFNDILDFMQIYLCVLLSFSLGMARLYYYYKEQVKHTEGESKSQSSIFLG